jgi:hypothetical protein
MSIAEFYVENCIDPDDPDALGAFLASHRDESDNEDDYLQDDDDHEQMKMPRSIQYRQLEISTNLATDRLDAGTACKETNEIVATSKVGASLFNDSSKDNTVFNGAALKGDEETAKGIYCLYLCRRDNCIFLQEAESREAYSFICVICIC